MLTVTKRVEFCYAHFLPNYDGPCATMHGHNAVLEVEINQKFQIRHKAIVYDGMIIEFKELSKIINASVLQVFDHKLINHFIDVPTAESMVLYIAEKLETFFGDALVRVRLYETPDSYAEWKLN